MTETMKTSWAKLNDKSNKNTRTQTSTHTHTDAAKWSKAQSKTKQNKA